MINQTLQRNNVAAVAARYNPETGRYRTTRPEVETFPVEGRTGFWLNGQPVAETEVRALTGITPQECLLCALAVPDIHSEARRARLMRGAEA